MERRIGISVLALACTVFACSPTVSPPPSVAPPSPVAPSPSTTPTAAATAGPTGQAVDPDTLPKAALDPDVTTVVCDEAPSDDLLPCTDAAQLAARVAASRPLAPARVWYERPAQIIHLGGPGGWAAITPDPQTGWIVVSAAPPAWPDALPFDPPAAALAPLLGAPAAIAGRAPYPLCGTSRGTADPGPLSCFLSAVLAGSPAEVVVLVPDTGATWLYRHAGTGAVIRFRYDTGPWMQGAGSVQLDASPGTWSFDPWPGEVPVP